MGGDYPSYIYGDHCYNYDLMCTIVYNEYEHSEEQQQCNAADRAEGSGKR